MLQGQFSPQWIKNPYKLQTWLDIINFTRYNEVSKCPNTRPKTPHPKRGIQLLSVLFHLTSGHKVHVSSESLIKFLHNIIEEIRCDSGTSGGRRIWNTRGPLEVADSEILGDLRILGVIWRWNVCLMTTLTLLLILRLSWRLSWP